MSAFENKIYGEESNHIICLRSLVADTCRDNAAVAICAETQSKNIWVL